MPSNNYSTRQLSTPQVLVDGVTIAIVPNKCKVRIPGDTKVRAMSSGGGSVQTVHGFNAESLVGKVDFEIANTAENSDRVRKWKANARLGIGSTITVIETDVAQYVHQNMYLTKDTELVFSSDGSINLEWEGDYVP